MVNLKNIGRAVSLIPGKYYLAVAGTVIVGLLYGIGKTITAPVAAPPPVKLEAKAQKPLLEGQQPAAAIPSAIADGNLFRRQRTGHKPPPPLQPADPNEPVPDVKLLGIIITDDKKLAILDAELKRYTKIEAPLTLVLSGVHQPMITEGDKFYNIIPIKGEKLASQTFNEGDIVAEYTLAHIYEDSIELSSLASGRKTTIFLETEEAAKSLKSRVSRSQGVFDSPQKNIPLSGALAR